MIRWDRTFNVPRETSRRNDATLATTALSHTHSRPKPMPGPVRWCSTFVAASGLLALPLTSAVRATRTAAQLPDAPGRLVDIGGQRIHLNCTGSGSPTVVFENGAGDFSMVWSFVQPRVATFTRACSYDRAGYAWSDPGNRPRTYDQITLELHTALDRAGERGPYVLVGQSYGGLLARGFARRYAKDVAGVVLVDAVHEDQRIQMGGGKVRRIRDFATRRVRPEPRIAADSPLIVLRRSGASAPADTSALEAPLDRLPRAEQDAWRAALADSVYRLAWAAEMDWSPEELQRMHAERVHDRATLGTLPLVVISRAPENVHLEEPHLVVEAVRNVVRGVR